MYNSLRRSALFVITVLAGVVFSSTASASYPPQAEDVPWPTEAWPEVEGGEGSKRAELEALIGEHLFGEGPEFFQGGRGVVVIHKGKLVAEVYRDGFDRNSRFLSWSEGKSITQALVGIAVHRGLLAVDEGPGFAEWDGTDREAVTIDSLLRMSSGLKFTEGAGGLDDNSIMMFGEGRLDQAAYAASLPLIHEPGTHWAYATGTTMLLSRAVREKVGNTGDDYYAFIHDELLDVLGMKSGVPEFDEAGTFLGGTSFYATTRDYARFGLLYLRDGVWEDKRLLPEGWVDYTRTATPGSDGRYGAQFWLGPVGKEEALAEAGLELPDDMFQARGATGQFIAIIPSRDLVIAYNGVTLVRGYWPIDHLFARILSTLEDREMATASAGDEE